MTGPSTHEITQLLQAWGNGDEQALEKLTPLGTLDLRKSQVVELRFFGGLTVDETAEALRVSSDTVLRDWRLAKDWLVRELSGGPQ
jgi:DNA-directed RNA polymerase specialized sigma24 family protein